MAETVFWGSWLGTLVVCAWTIYRAVRSPERLLEWPVVVCVMWAYFYVYMAYQAHAYLQHRVPENVFAIGEVVPLVSLLGLLFGWRLGVGTRMRMQPRAPRALNANFLWWIGMALLTGGALASYRNLNAIMLAELEGGQFDWHGSSAYEYLLYHIGYPGLAIALWGALQMRLRNRILALVPLVAGAVAFIFPYILTGRRGPFFPLVITFLYIPLFARQVRPRATVVLGTLLLSGLTMTAFLQVRMHNYEWSRVFQEVELKQVLVQRTAQEEDNEFVNSAFFIHTLSERGMYQYGTGHLSLLLHWVPRSVYPSKHGLGDGWFHTQREAMEETNITIGRNLLGGGAAAAVVADSFLQYGPLTPLFFMGIGWLVARLYRRALLEQNVRWDVAYVGAICGTHWFVSQGFAAAFVPELAYQTVPWITFALFRYNRRDAGLPGDARRSAEGPARREVRLTARTSVSEAPGPRLP